MRGWHLKAAALLSLALGALFSPARAQDPTPQSAGYPAEVCPLVHASQPNTLCSEATSLLWYNLPDGNPFNPRYFPSLEAYLSHLLTKAQEQGCVDCKIISQSDVLTAKADNAALGGQMWDMLPLDHLGQKTSTGGELHFFSALLQCRDQLQGGSWQN